MNRPIQVDSPTAAELQILRDRQREHSFVYKHVLATCGIGRAEEWINALAVSRGTDALSIAARSMSSTAGWTLSFTAESERIAKRAAPSARSSSSQ